MEGNHHIGEEEDGHEGQPEPGSFCSPEARQRRERDLNLSSKTTIPYTHRLYPRSRQAARAANKARGKAWRKRTRARWQRLRRLLSPHGNRLAFVFGATLCTGIGILVDGGHHAESWLQADLAVNVAFFFACPLVAHIFRSHTVVRYYYNEKDPDDPRNNTPIRLSRVGSLFKVGVHFEPAPGWIPCPKCGGDQGFVNDHGVARKIGDVGHVRFGNYGSKAEYLTRSHFAKGQRGGPHTFWIPCDYCGERGVIPDHPARRHTQPVNKSSRHQLNPDHPSNIHTRTRHPGSTPPRKTRHDTKGETSE